MLFYATEEANVCLKKPERRFVFVHVAGLDRVGPTSGWLSPEYMEELSFIDEFLGHLFETAKETAG